MDESLAWLSQGLADRRAADLILAEKKEEDRCHVIAKWQQTVEKTIKAIVAALREAGVGNVQIGYRHEVTLFFRTLLRLPRIPRVREIQNLLRALLDEPTRAGIVALDALVPQRPPPGVNPQRNTEYPFYNNQNRWTFPANPDTFSSQEMQRFRELAYRIASGAARIVSAIRRLP